MLKKSVQEKKTKLENKGSIRALRPLHIAQDLSWNYGEDVVVYDVREKTPYVSYFILASASTDRRLRALVGTAKEALYNNYKDVDHTEGRNDSTWILVDAHDIVVHLFTKEERKRVDMDALYVDCPHKIVVSKEEPNYRKRKKAESQDNNWYE